MNIKQNNRHAPRRTPVCPDCGRHLPRRSYRARCATCTKRTQGKPVMRFNRAIRRYMEVAA